MTRDVKANQKMAEKQTADAATSAATPEPTVVELQARIKANVDKLVAKWKAASGIPDRQETTAVQLLKEDILSDARALHADGAKNSDALVAAQAETDKAREEIKYARAELFNFQERSKRELHRLVNLNTREFIEVLLPWLDNFSVSLDNCRKGPEGEALTAEPVAAAFVEAVELLHGQLLQVLEGRGVVSFDATGKRFNPAEHVSVAKIPVPDKHHEEVVDVVKPGYLYKKELLRPASVVIADNPDNPFPVEAEAEATSEEPSSADANPQGDA